MKESYVFSLCVRSRSRLFPLIIPVISTMSKVCCQATVLIRVLSRSPCQERRSFTSIPGQQVEK